jgi:hypothetical protein
MNKQIETVINLALGEVGYVEEPKGSNKNKYAKEIDDLRKEGKCAYNYPKNGVAWCDVFHDWLHIHSFGFDEGMYHLCQPEKSAGAGCKYSAQYYKDAGRWFDEPEVGDQIFFIVNGDINHTGIVTKVDDKKVYTVEGNSGDAVKAHSYNKNGNKKIAGYGRPRWKEEASSIADTAPTKPEPIQKPQNDAQKSLEELAREIIDGKWGNGKERQKKLTDAGYDYAKVQAKVNEILAAKKPQASDVFTGIVNTSKNKLNIRSGAGTNYPIIGTLTKGSKVNLKNGASGWYKLADRAGYVSANYIKKS